MQTQDRLKVLFVDDEEDLVFSISTYLGAFADVITANCGNEAIQLLHKEKPDLILTDYKMPNGTGMDLLKASKQAYPDTPIIIMSAYGDFNLLKNSIESGLDEFIEKPCSIDYLTQRILKSLERVKLKRVCKKFELYGSLLTGLLHDLSTPLSSVNLAKEQLEYHLGQTSVNSDKIKRLVQIIGTSTATSIQILESIKQEVQHMHSDYSFVDAHVLIKKLENIYNFNNKIHTKISFHIEDKNILFWGQEITIYRILQNLINNSIEATRDQKNPWIQISCERNNNFVVFKVKDSGGGIPDSIKEKIFAPFFSTKATENENLGMGLSIAKEIVNKFNGDLYVDYESKNTTFILKIPHNKSEIAAA